MKLSTILISMTLALSMTMTVAAEKQAAQTAKPAMTKELKAAQAAIDSADASRKKAASVEGEWRDTGKIINQAKAALTEGDTKKAIKLANFAERQGNYGYEQAMSQKDFKMPSYLKY